MAPVTALGAFAILAGPGHLAAQRPTPPENSSLWISDTPLDETRRLLVVVDPVGRHAALYHVDAVAGTLTLRSTRDIAWDLLVDDFNAQEPKPAALKKMLQVGPVTTPERPR
jgi:hypothetical protein